jgi:hypothetical protein
MLRVRGSYSLFSYQAIQTAASGTLLVLGNDIDGDYRFIVSGLFYVSFLRSNLKRLILRTYTTVTVNSVAFGGCRVVRGGFIPRSRN